MKKTRMKRGKGGLMAFLAAGVLMVNVVPVRANEGWEWLWPLLPVMYDVVKDLVNGDAEGLSGGGSRTERIKCWSAGYQSDGATYVNCSTCTVLPGHYEGPNGKCTRLVN